MLSDRYNKPQRGNASVFLFIVQLRQSEEGCGSTGGNRLTKPLMVNYQLLPRGAEVTDV